jgi:hypothetical protein
MFLKYLLIGVKYFAIQLLIETFVVVILTYLGLPYSGLIVGGSSLGEVIIGTFGFYTFYKAIFFSWLYLPLFASISAYKKYQNQFAFSILNGVLCLPFPLLVLCFQWMVYDHDLDLINKLNLLIAPILTSALIIVIVKMIENRKRQA